MTVSGINFDVERLSSDQEMECRISSPHEVNTLLGRVVSEGSRSVLYFGRNKNDFIVTSILSVRNNQVIVERGGDARFDARVADASGIAVVTVLDRVKMQFFVDKAVPGSFMGYSAFFLPIPEVVYRIQRRQFFRLEAPPGLHCAIKGNKGVEIPAIVLDISVGGIHLSFPGNAECCVQDGCHECLIDLPDVGRVDLELSVVAAGGGALPSGKPFFRARCRFSDLEPASAAMLQRYINLMQRHS